MRPQILNTIEAAAYLGLAASTLEKARVAGTGPRFLKLGRAVRYLSSELDTYLLAHMVRSTSEPVGPDRRR